jgi:hypothetical protein
MMMNLIETEVKTFITKEKLNERNLKLLESRIKQKTKEFQTVSYGCKLGFSPEVNRQSEQTLPNIPSKSTERIDLRHSLVRPKGALNGMNFLTSSPKDDVNKTSMGLQSHRVRRTLKYNDNEDDNDMLFDKSRAIPGTL